MIDPGELVERIWERDPTVWTGKDEAQWLGWLDEPLRMRQRLGELGELAEAADGADDVVLLGMGGSSLAPEVLRRAFGRERFHVLDTTHPRAIRRLADSLDLEPDPLRRLVEIGRDARDEVALRLLLGARRQALHRDHRSRLTARTAGENAQCACLRR